MLVFLVELTIVKRDFLVFSLLLLLTILVFRSALLTFFVQDDFIFIDHFSKNFLFWDLENVFGMPEVTHWRPIHNLYFFISGNIFDKNYFLYHLLTFLFHAGTGFLIYKTVNYFLKDGVYSFLAALFYIVNPSHFISLNWISGGAVLLGFFFLMLSIYFSLLGKKVISIISYIFSILASEAMLGGFFLFSIYSLHRRKKVFIKDKQIITLAVFSLVFLIIRVFALTPKQTFDVYRFELSVRILDSVKYYLLRIAGFAEVSGDYFTTGTLLIFLLIIGATIVKNIGKVKTRSLVLIATAIIVIGLFPFILIPSHLSPHYMSISIWGFSMITAFSMKYLGRSLAFFLAVVYVGMAFVNVGLIKNNNWVISRSNIARTYLQEIGRENYPAGSKLIFGDSEISSSEEAYILLGQGKAISVWFPDKNYRACFVAFENC